MPHTQRLIVLICRKLWTTISRSLRTNTIAPPGALAGSLIILLEVTRPARVYRYQVDPAPREVHSRTVLCELVTVGSCVCYSHIVKAAGAVFGEILQSM